MKCPVCSADVPALLFVKDGRKTLEMCQKCVDKRSKAEPKKQAQKTKAKPVVAPKKMVAPTNVADYNGYLELGYWDQRAFISKNTDVNLLNSIMQYEKSRGAGIKARQAEARIKRLARSAEKGA